MNRYATIIRTVDIVTQESQQLSSLPLVQKALLFAKNRHDGQFRRLSPHHPFVLHCVQVAIMVQENQGTPETVAAALLHDTVEDTSTTIEEIQENFGETVTTYVRALTEENKSLEWEIRREQARQKLFRAGPEVMLIKCADIISNVQDLIDYSQREDAEDLWQYFKRGKQKKIESWTKVYQIIYEKDPTCALLPKLAQTLEVAETVLPE